MTNPNINLTNQELIKELQNRIDAGNIEFQATSDHQTQTYSLLSKLGSKEWLLLIGLSVAFTFLICSSLSITTNQAIGATIGLRENKNPVIEIGEVTNP